jgi:hypothetical protein
MDFYRILASIAYVVATIVGMIAIYFGWKIHRIKYQAAELEREIADRKLKAISDEANNKMAVLKQTAQHTTEISDAISQKLIDNPTWLDKFMDQTGVTYSASVYGKRIGHFYSEKAIIAKQAVDKVEEHVKKNPSNRYCLVIDSGTTMYPVFQEITSRIRPKKGRELWRERLCIVTNNIPGVQYLMKNAKDDPNDDYSEISINCFIVPGKPLSVYAAITGIESINWLGELRALLQNLEGWKGDKVRIHIIAFVTGNYMVRKHAKGSISYHPAARGEGHVEIKKAMIEISDELFLLSPLMKFSFASVDLLNRVNGFDIERTDLEKARQQPNKVKYEEIPIPGEKRTIFFLTKRPTGARFRGFSVELQNELVERYGADGVVMPEYDIRYWDISDDGSARRELEREVPHETLRRAFENGSNIWDKGWVLGMSEGKARG